MIILSKFAFILPITRVTIDHFHNIIQPYYTILDTPHTSYTLPTSRYTHAAPVSAPQRGQLQALAPSHNSGFQVPSWFLGNYLVHNNSYRHIHCYDYDFILCHSSGFYLYIVDRDHQCSSLITIVFVQLDHKQLSTATLSLEQGDGRRHHGELYHNNYYHNYHNYYHHYHYHFSGYAAKQDCWSEKRGWLGDAQSHL